MYTVEFCITPADLPTLRRAVTRVESRIGTVGLTIAPATVEKKAHYHEIEGVRGHIELVLDGYSPLTVHRCTLTVDPDRYMTAGYSLLARRTASPDGADFVEWYVEEADRVAIPDLHRSECQACGRKVARSETYIIASPDGAVMQVGGSCKDQFIPSQAVSYLTSMRNLMMQVTELETDLTGQGGGGGYEQMWKVAGVIAHSISVLKSRPFVRSTDEWGQANADATWRVVRAEYRHGELVEYGTSTPWTPEILECLNDLRNSDSETDRDITAYDWCNVKGLAFLPSAVRSWMKRKAEAVKPHVDPVMPPTGRVILEGTVTSQKMVSTDFGDTYKMLLDCGAYRVWGTVPGNLAVGLGDRVRLTATVQPKELGFGFYSRPAKAEVIPA